MQIEFSEDFLAPVDSIVAFMQSEELQRAKATALNALDFRFDARTEGGTVVTSTRILPTAGLPEFVKAMVRPTMTVVEREVWAAPEGGTHRGTFDIDVEGAPVRHRGAVEVTPVGTGARVTFSGKWQATVPLFRSNIEEASLQSLRQTIETEFALIAEHVSVLRH